MPKCHKCGKDHAAQDTLVTVTVPKMHLIGLTAMAGLAVMGMSQKISVEERMQAQLYWANMEFPILNDALPALIAIMKVLIASDPDKVLSESIQEFENTLKSLREANGH